MGATGVLKKNSQGFMVSLFSFNWNFAASCQASFAILIFLAELIGLWGVKSG
jgi:hypothetical protein